MSLLSKLFCNHKWNSHDKQNFERFIDGKKVLDYTREVLICECCGKIKTIEY